VLVDWVDPARIVGDSTVFVASSGETVTTLTTKLRAWLTGDPQYIVTQLRGAATTLLIEAYISLRDDSTYTKPASFYTLKFLNLTNSHPFDFNSVASAAALDILKNKVTFLTSSPQIDTVAYDNSIAAFEAFDANFSLATVNDYEYFAYDSIMMLALAITAAGTTTDGPAIVTAMRDVTSPPGVKVYPGEYNKARQLILAGYDVDYDGAISNRDMSDTRQTVNFVEPWYVGADGLTTGPLGTGIFIPSL
jgi:hypothetical protein